MNAFTQFSLPLANPLGTAAGTIDHREGFVVRVGDDPTGLGEATPLPGWTESVDACADALEAALPAGDARSTPSDLPPMGATPAARHGLELALLDRAARVERVPLYRYLGGARRVRTVPVNATVGDGDARVTAAAGRAAVERGFRAVKVKVGARPVDADVERLAAVREVVGNDVEVRVDANGAWRSEQAAEAIGRLDDVGVSLVEQPLEPDALAAHADLRGDGVAIALDESLRERPVGEVLAAGAADVLVLKPMVLGGIGPAMTVADRARDHDVDVVVTTTVDAAVARAGAVHLAAALDVDRACGLATADRLVRDVAADPAPVVDGGSSVPQASGHGVAVEELD